MVTYVVEAKSKYFLIRAQNVYFSNSGGRTSNLGKMLRTMFRRQIQRPRPRQPRTILREGMTIGVVVGVIGLRLEFGWELPIRTEKKRPTIFFNQNDSPPRLVSRLVVSFSLRTAVFISLVYRSSSFCWELSVPTEASDI